MLPESCFWLKEEEEQKRLCGRIFASPLPPSLLARYFDSLHSFGIDRKQFLYVSLASFFESFADRIPFDMRSQNFIATFGIIVALLSSEVATAKRYASPQRSIPFHGIQSASYRNCLTKSWHGLEEYVNRNFAAAVESICGEMSRKGDLPSLPTLMRLAVIKRLTHSVELRPLWERFLHDVMASTKVNIVLATYDRPAMLSNALATIHNFTSHCTVSVLYDASNGEVMSAYETVLKKYPVESWRREEHGGYFPTLLKILKNDHTTNVIVASDDTFFVQPFNCAVHGALQRILSAGFQQLHRVSMQLRISYAVNTDPVIGSLAAPDTPYLFLVNCTSARGPKAEPACYDSHIDGPMYLIENIRKDWSSLQQPNQHGEMEGQWISRHRENGTDVSVFLAHQAVLNVGMAVGTVRDDRKFLESETFIRSQKEMRQLHARAILAGCEQNPMSRIADYFSPATHVAGIPLSWTCPEGVDPPGASK